MRINHVGEICAQALYQGQSLTSRDPSVRDALRHAAVEETEHLCWTAGRIAELGARTSLLNPLWYGGALLMGVSAGLIGDKWMLGNSLVNLANALRGQGDAAGFRLREGLHSPMVSPEILG